MSMTFKAGDATIHRIIEMEVRLHAGAGVPAEPDEGSAGREPVLAASGRAGRQRQSGTCAFSHMS
jgi:hypothetical protein